MSKTVLGVTMYPKDGFIIKQDFRIVLSRFSTRQTFRLIPS